MPRFVAYYRVSTDRQGASGLGLDAQREAVRRHTGSASPIAEYTEIESGKKHGNRPQLLAALEECRKRKATLIIAKLDRMARNVHFISGLMESGVEFVACDMPHANRLTIHILAAVAEHEREMISQRTKAALAEAKKRGTRLGSPDGVKAAAIARAARNIQPPPPDVVQIMRDMLKRGESLRGIARQLNRLNIRTPQGCQWYAQTVKQALAPLRSRADEAA